MLFPITPKMTFRELIRILSEHDYCAVGYIAKIIKHKNYTLNQVKQIDGILKLFYSKESLFLGFKVLECIKVKYLNISQMKSFV